MLYLFIMIDTYEDKIYINFRGLNVPDGGVECESFIIVSIDSLLFYENNVFKAD